MKKKKKDVSYLYTPIQSIVDPPIDTKTHELPLEKLHWEDFEKLCLAIVQKSFSINDCRIYGTKGQAQEGIDIFARQPNGRYSTYQCKRYQEFDVEDINKVIEKFKKGKFYKKSDNLYLCTSCELNKTQIQDRFEVLKTELEKENITLIKWDKIQLERELKTQPQIVYDFFGSEWVKKFNGEEFLQQISKSKKLDAPQVVKLRKELYEFYSTIFNVHDFGLPSKVLNSPYALQERFIIPDILLNVKNENFEITKDQSHYSTINQDQFHYDDYGYNQSENEFRYRRLNNHSEAEESSIDIRIKIDEALVNNNINVIIGDPGAGKSSLLRYITLDILSSEPQLKTISQKYGNTLPIWLPFAFITKQINKNDTLSISEILRYWFNSLDKNYLFDIVKDALEDERLFLIVDGIDEWNSISSAELAIKRLETLRGLFNCKILYSSRPYGFRILKDHFTNLNVLNLAGFSKVQQKDFVEKWYNKWISLQKESNDQSISKTQTNNFIKELEQTGDLKKLAEIPLLLSILIVQKMQNAVLPRNKLEALKEITHYLIEKHPIKRITDAGIVQKGTNEINFKDIFCELAIYIQKESNDVVLKIDAQKIIEEYLIKYAEYDKVKAKVSSQKLIEVGANSFGIIIEKSNDEISFSHKQFQEFLAAQYLFDSNENIATEFIKQYAASPVFHQVIINLFGLIPSRRTESYKNYFQVLKEANHEKYQQEYLKLISYEIAINSDNTPSDIMNNAFNSIMRDFEYETDPIYKEALLKRILTALQNVRLKERVQNFLLQYFPNQNKYIDYRVYALQYLNELNGLQTEFLKKAFINGTIGIKLDACYAFKKHIKNKTIYDFTKEIILNCFHPDILAFAINSIITTDLTEQERDSLIDFVKVDVPIVQFFLFKHKVFSKKNTQNDLEHILSIINQLPYHLNQEIIDLLIDGFGQNEELKKTLIKSLDGYGEETNIIDKEIVWNVLFRSFNKDRDVINLIKSEFEREEFPFLLADGHKMLRSLTNYFKGNSELIPSMETWLNKRLKRSSYIDSEVAFVGVFIHTEDIKNTFLQGLSQTKASYWNIMVLLAGWSDDLEVKEKLKEYMRTSKTTKISDSAIFIPKIFDNNEKEEAIKILEDILLDKKIIFKERAISAFLEIDKEYFEKNILKILIDELDTFPKDIFGEYYSILYVIVKNFYSNPIIQFYVLERIKSDHKLYNLSIQYFPELIEEEEKILEKSVPLSKNLRSLIIKYFADLSSLPETIEITLNNFESEEEEEIMGDMAICLFNHLKETNTNKIIELCSPLVFARGSNHETKRRIAFLGYLITQNIEKYFSIEDIETNNSKPRVDDIFNLYTYKISSSGMMIKSIIDNFDYLISPSEKGFNPIEKHLKFSKDTEDLWAFVARHSAKSSPTYKYIMEFICNNKETIKNDSIISFLNRTTPRNSILKDILLRLINDSNKSNRILAGRLLGKNFKNNNQVYHEVKNVQNLHDIGRIIALCNGWIKEPILKEKFDEIDEPNVDIYVAYELNFLFREVKELIEFLKNVFTNVGDKHHHKYFVVPMIERLKRDEDFGLAIKNLLLSSSLITEKISYYNLLYQANMVDEEVILWKNKITDFKNDFGYDIVSNKTVRLKDVLHDYYY